MQKLTLSLRNAEHVVAHHADQKTDDAMMAAMVRAAREIAEAADGVEKTVGAIMGNKMATETKNLADAKAAAARIYMKQAPKIDATRSAVEAAIDKLIAETQPAQPKDAIEALGHQEVRLAIAHLSQAERSKVIGQAISDGDDAFVAAAVLGHPTLTGLGPAERDALREAWRKARHGDALDRIARLRSGLQALDRVGSLFSGYALGMFAENAGEIEAAEKSAKAAKDALSAA